MHLSFYYKSYRFYNLNDLFNNNLTTYFNKNNYPIIYYQRVGTNVLASLIMKVPVKTGPSNEPITTPSHIHFSMKKKKFIFIFIIPSSMGNTLLHLQGGSISYSFYHTLNYFVRLFVITAFLITTFGKVSLVAVNQLQSSTFTSNTLTLKLTLKFHYLF